MVLVIKFINYIIDFRINFLNPIFKKVTHLLLDLFSIKYVSDILFFNNNVAKLTDNVAHIRFEIPKRDRKICKNDNTKTLGFDRHYIYHTAWAARILKETNPILHVDISSALYFTSIMSSFLNMEHYDFRRPDLQLSNLKVGEADLTNLHFESNSISSLSCMHTVEHVGLGRYGDPLDYDGDLKAFSELKRVVAKNGNLLIVVPIGKDAKIIFNAHRIYTRDMVLDIFKGFELLEFCLIPEKSLDGGLVRNPSNELLESQNYGCGCFHFLKK